MTISREKIIGGKFGFPTHFYTNKSTSIFLDGDPILLFNARSGIKLIIDQLKPENVWVPSYLCPTILSAIDRSITTMRFYPINSRLEISSLEFLDQIQANDILLAIDYFGFPTDCSILTLVQAKGCRIIRDCSQALFLDFRSDNYEFHLFSPRKFLGVPDGGILHISDRENIIIPTLTIPPDEIRYAALQALLHRWEFDLHGGDRSWRQEFDQVEEGFQPGYFRMSELTQLLLENAFDYEQICAQRRNNFYVLKQLLGDYALFPDLPGNVIPLGFPVRVQNRDELQRKLFSKNIYPPIHWEIDQFVPAEFFDSHELSQSIMTLPCDHRYDQEDMHYMAQTLRDLV